MPESLFLNKKQVDSYIQPITRKIQIGEVSEITEIKSSYSYTIKIPATSKNLQILDMISTSGNTSRKPFEEVVADYYIDGLPMVLNGSAIIRSIDAKEIQLNLIDGFRGLSVVLGDKKVSELDFSSYNHSASKEAVVDSYTNTDGYIYAFADFGKGYEESAVQYYENLAPSFYVNTIVDMIFSEAGFLKSGDFFTTDAKYLKEVLTPCRGYEITPAGTTVVISELFGDLKQIDLIKFIANKHGLLMQYNSNEEDFEFKKIQEVLNSEDTAEDWTEKISNFNEQEFASGYAKVNLAKYSYASSAFEELDGELVVDNENASEEGTLFSSPFEVPAISGLYGHSAPLPSKAIYSIPIWGAAITKIAILEESVAPNSTLFPSARLLQTGGQTTDINYRIKAFVVDIYNNARSEYKAYAAKGTVEDADAAMVCYYTDADVFISYEIAGSGSVVSYEKISLTVPTTTGIIRVMGTGASLPLLYEYDNYDYDSAENSSTPSKIMYVDLLASQSQVQEFSFDGSVTSEYTPYLTTKFMSLQYSIDNNYKSFTDLLNDYKKRTLLANLSLIDIVNNDFFKLKFLKQTGRFYYLNNIQHTNGQLSKCEALEIANFATNYSPTISDIYRKVTSYDLTSVKEIIVSKANFLVGYYDEEFDAPLKLKLISGFNSNIKLYQDAVEITVETEIDFEDLNLLATAQVLNGSNYSESWVFKISDAGSEEYSEESAELTIEAFAFIDYIPQTPNAVATLKSGENSEITLGIENDKIMTGISSTLPYDIGDDSKYFEFTIISKPVGSTAHFEQNYEDYEGTLIFDGVAADLGDYTIRMTITTPSGATDYDDKALTIIETT